MRCLVAVVFWLMAVAGGTAPVARAQPGPAVLRPDVGKALLQTDITKPPHRPQLPPELEKPGAGYWGLFKICVSATGEVSGITAVKSTGSGELDAAWSSTIRGWRYQPYAVDGAAVPFCHVMRLQAGDAPAAPVKPVIIDPKVGSGRLLTNVQKDPHRPRLPQNLNVTNTVLWGLYKVCVNTEGQVSEVGVVRSAGSTVLPRRYQTVVDASWMETIKTWRYQPYSVSGKPVAFCYPLRLTVSAK